MSMAQILVLDSTLRAGEQAPGCTLTPGEKLRMAHELAELGVDIIEAGFPVASMDDFTAVRSISEEVKDSWIAAVARARPGDIDRAASALDRAAKPRIHTFMGTSDIHLRHCLEISREECLDRVGEAVRRARRYTPEVEFTATDAGRADLDFLARVLAAAVEAGATTVNLADTVGYAHPSEFEARVASMFSMVPGLDGLVVSVQCHNDLGLAVANSLAGIRAGARQVECTVNGIGERGGMAALEEVVMALTVRRDLLDHHTGIRTGNLHRASHLLGHLTGIHPHDHKPVVGRNAFSHKSGAHQDGMLKERTAYEVMEPDQVGAPGSRMVMGKHSGRHALASRLEELGYPLEEDDLDRAYRLFSMLADQKQEILDEDLVAILHYGAMEDVPRFLRLASLTVQCGANRSRAEVELQTRDGIRKSGTGIGDGPVAAALAAVDAATGHSGTLEDLTIRATTPGRDAVGEANLVVRIDGRSFSGRGASTDIVNAATRAYLHALNKAEQAAALEQAGLKDQPYPWGP
jgi:2-isopropylmalate synthase